MQSNGNNQLAIRSYLLGKSSDPVREDLERQLITDEATFEELEISENELIDDYLQEKLEEIDRLAFEQNFLVTPERRRKVQFARALNTYVSNAQAPAQITSSTKPSFWRAFWENQSTVLRPALAVAVLILIVGGIWLYRSREISPQSFATIALTMSPSTRAQGAESKKVQLPLNADALKIRLELPETQAPASQYRVELMKENGETKSLSVAEKDAQSVSVVVPTAQLSRGQYALRLFEIGADGVERRISGNYFFTVE